MLYESRDSTLDDVKTKILNFVWKIESKIGSGSYGNIYQGTSIYTSAKIAIKKFKENNIDEGISSDTLREIVSLRKLKHNNIISILDVIIDYDSVYIVQELMQTDLHNYIQTNNGVLPLKIIKNILYQILNGVTYIHSRNFLHRDLKPQNILINTTNNNDLIVKITDFGLCRLFTKDKQFTKGTCTPLYRAPEIILGVQEYTNAVDIWSIGCIFAEMCLGEPLYNKSDNELDILKHILDIHSIDFEVESIDNLKELLYKLHWETPLNKFEKKFPMLNKEGLDLLGKFLTINPNKRIHAKDALEHCFFSD